jgi:hypothetical protein
MIYLHHLWLQQKALHILELPETPALLPEIHKNLMCPQTDQQCLSPHQFYNYLTEI